MPAGFMKRAQSPYFATGNPETEESTTLYAPGMLGCVSDYDQGQISGPPNICTYQLVLATLAISAGFVGEVYTWSSKAAWTVVAGVASSGQVAGVGAIINTLLNPYIWILKRGDRNVRFVDAPAVAPSNAGLAVFLSATTGKADCVANTTAEGNKTFGATLGAQDGTSKLGLVRVNCIDQY